MIKYASDKNLLKQAHFSKIDEKIRPKKGLFLENRMIK